MLYLNTIGAELFIKKYKNSIRDSFWNNYELVIWEKNSSGYFNTEGMYHLNSWGIHKSYGISDKGLWRLPKKYVKHLK
jgi:hypothetical protein